MTRHEEIDAAIVRQLDEWDTPVNDAVLQAAVTARIEPRLLLSEFNAALERAEKAGWISGIRTGFKGIRWHITDTGRAELNR